MLRSSTSDTLPPATARELRALLDSAFEGDFSDDDWHHARGGDHVWIVGPDGILAHASVVPRQLVCDGHVLRAGYVEAVATARSARRQGHGARVMRRINAIVRRRFDIGALSTGTHAFYESVGWERWRGPTLVGHAAVRTPTPDDDGDIMILPTRRTPLLDLGGPIVCDWRPGDVW